MLEASWKVLKGRRQPDWWPETCWKKLLRVDWHHYASCRSVFFDARVALLIEEGARRMSGGACHRDGWRH